MQPDLVEIVILNDRNTIASVWGAETKISI